MIFPADDATSDEPAAFVNPPEARRDTDAVPIAVAVALVFTLPSIVMTRRCAADEYVLSPPVYHCAAARGKVRAQGHHSIQAHRLPLQTYYSRATD